MSSIALFKSKVFTNKVAFYHDRRSSLIPALAYSQITHASDALGWKGLYLEVGDNFGCNVDELMMDGHFVGMQLLDEPIDIRIRSGAQWANRVMPPRSIWIHPEGTPFSISHSEYSRWAGMVIDGAYMDDVMGAHYELTEGYAIKDELLAGLIGSLVALVKYPRHEIASDDLLSKDLIETFVRVLAKTHGRCVNTGRAGGIAPHQLQSLMAWVQENIEEHLTVEAMAAQVKLSTAHFSREFKRSTGSTPWAYVLDLRLNLARALLLQGEKVANVVYRCKFSDHSHMCRAMRTKFGTSPRELLKTVQR